MEYEDFCKVMEMSEKMLMSFDTNLRRDALRYAEEFANKFPGHRKQWLAESRKAYLLKGVKESDGRNPA